MPELCEKCRQRPAVVHIRAAAADGQVRSYNLCPPCTMAMIADGELGDGIMPFLQSAIKSGSADLGRLLDGDLLSTVQQLLDGHEDQECPECKLRLSRLTESHLLGCPQCLETFREPIRRLLGPALEEQRRHRSDASMVLTQTPEQFQLTVQGKELRQRLDDAVRGEKYEEAAILKEQLEGNDRALVELGRQRENRSDAAQEAKAAAAFLALPRCNYGGGSKFCQPWLPWDNDPADPRPRIRLSSFVNLSRNLAGYPFTPALKEDAGAAQEICDAILDALRGDPLFRDAQVFDPAALDEAQRSHMVASRWIPSDMCNRTTATRLVLSANRRLVLRINYLDHLQVQLWGRPDDFQANAAMMAALDQRLQRSLAFATDQEFGSVSRDIHSLGSGVNFGCFLHLPATMFEGRAEAAARACRDLGTGLRLRSLFTHNDHDNGAIYSVRTANAMGDTILGRCQLLRRAAIALERRELEARAYLRGEPETRLRLSDQLSRALAIVSGARLMEMSETRTILSLLWFAAELGMLPGFRVSNLWHIYHVIRDQRLNATTASHWPARIQTLVPRMLRMLFDFPELPE